MITIERTYCECPRPRSFAGLMELYEHNYMRLRCLCPELALVEAGACSRVAGGMDLYLQMLDGCRFTSTLRLTYLFAEQPDGPQALPDLRLRMYHDARQVEVLTRRCKLSETGWVYWPSNLHELVTCKWRLNRFLYKWLGFCLRQGHRFNAERLQQAQWWPVEL